MGSSMDLERRVSELEKALGKGLAGMNVLLESTAQDVSENKSAVATVSAKVHSMEVRLEVAKARVDDLRSERGDASQKLRALELSDAKDLPATERHKASSSMKAAIIVAVCAGVFSVVSTIVQLVLSSGH